jgi:hypothetical protein
MGLFYDYLRRERSLYRAWQHVRSSAENSSNERTLAQVSAIDDRLPSVVRGLSARLSRGTFKFSQADGVLKDRAKRLKEGKSPRPIVVSVLIDRIVQRSILDALQPSKQEKRYASLGCIEEANNSYFSIGGTVGGGVETGIERLLDTIKQGNFYFFKSDISSFFTRIPHSEVCDIILNETGDEEIHGIFSSAIKVELANKDILAEYLDLFPHSGIGFAQGSSLSAFAGNLLLNQFDKFMNSGNTRMFRYIDDIVILGRSNEDVQKAKKDAINYLKRYDMGLYAPGTDRKKADEGHIRNGLLHLGCKITGTQVEPDKDAKQRILMKLRTTIQNAKKSILSLGESNAKRHKCQLAYYQSLSRLDRQIHGWGKSYRFITNRLPFAQIDKEVDLLLQEYQEWFFAQIAFADSKCKRRILGVTLLQDLPTATKRN